MIVNFDKFNVMNESFSNETTVFLYPEAIEEIIKMYNKRKGEGISLSVYDDPNNEQYILQACYATDRVGSDDRNWPWKTIFRKR